MMAVHYVFDSLKIIGSYEGFVQESDNNDHAVFD